MVIILSQVFWFSSVASAPLGGVVFEAMAWAADMIVVIMQLMGLHGKSFFSLVSGFGCNVPGIMATRTLEDPKDRLITMLINPLIPCVPRLGVMSAVVAAFFPGSRGAFIMVSLLLLSMLLVMFSALFLRRVVRQKERSAFVMELPLYQCSYHAQCALAYVASRQESLSMTQLATEVGYSVRELESALEQLEHMGYVRREILGQACSPGCGIDQCSGHCEGCGFLSTEAFTFWVLTEKGQIILSQYIGR